MYHEIIKLEWLSKEAKEAELVVSDGINNCLVFSQPCSLRLGQVITEPLHAFDIENLMNVIDTEKYESINKTDESYFSYYCIARVIDKSKSIVSIGGIVINLECQIPNWAYEGDLIEFKCSRLDIW